MEFLCVEAVFRQRQCDQKMTRTDNKLLQRSRFRARSFPNLSKVDRSKQNWQQPPPQDMRGCALVPRLCFASTTSLTQYKYPKEWDFSKVVVFSNEKAPIGSDQGRLTNYPFLFVNFRRARLAQALRSAWRVPDRALRSLPSSPARSASSVQVCHPGPSPRTQLWQYRNKYSPPVPCFPASRRSLRYRTLWCPSQRSDRLPNPTAGTTEAPHRTYRHSLMPERGHISTNCQQ